MNNASSPLTPQAFSYQLTLPTRFSDTDAVGHINNVSMFRYHDNTTMAFITNALDTKVWSSVGERLSIVRQDVSMDAETFYPDPVLLCAVVSDIGKEWFSLKQAIFQNGQCTGMSEVVLVWLDVNDLPAPLPHELLSQLEAY